MIGPKLLLVYTTDSMFHKRKNHKSQEPVVLQ